ncbi:hypothetical protein FDUTEX481_08350 [Tolypothrix sp. PCC 7601]|nr:hypothetical protein FDUTEX481_08350 [Tolypothrix sp. PCC 7601]
MGVVVTSLRSEFKIQNSKFKIKELLRIGDWGLGTRDWGLGINYF